MSGVLTVFTQGRSKTKAPASRPPSEAPVKYFLLVDIVQKGLYGELSFDVKVSCSGETKAFFFVINTLSKLWQKPSSERFKHTYSPVRVRNPGVWADLGV